MLFASNLPGTRSALKTLTFLHLITKRNLSLLQLYICTNTELHTFPKCWQLLIINASKTDKAEAYYVESMSVTLS